MTSKITDFLRRCASTVYAEPRSSLHDQITASQAATFAGKLALGASILDVGSGQGPALKWFSEHGFAPVGITLGEDCAVCREAGFIVHQCDQNDMAEGWTDTYDAIWARHVAEHSPIPLFTLCEYFRVLKPGGWLYMEVPAPGTVAGHCGNPNHYSVHTPEMWGSLLRKAGFTGAETYQGIKIPLAIGPDLYFAFTCQKPL